MEDLKSLPQQSHRTVLEEERISLIEDDDDKDTDTHDSDVQIETVSYSRSKQSKSTKTKIMRKKLKKPTTSKLQKGSLRNAAPTSCHRQASQSSETRSNIRLVSLSDLLAFPICKPNPLKCELCREQYFSEYSLRNHQVHQYPFYANDFDLEQRKCIPCGAKFGSVAALIKHSIQEGYWDENPVPKPEIIRVSENIRQMSERVMCNWCDRWFSSMASLEVHLIRDHEPLPTCQFCRDICLTDQLLTKHIIEQHCLPS